MASTSFLRNDIPNAASALLSFTGGFISSASSTISELNTGTTTVTTLMIDGQEFTSLSGGASGLTNNAGTLTANISEANLNITGTPTNNYVLQASSTAAGGFVWAATSTLGFEAAGVDNSTDVTLAGETYLTINGSQQITAAAIDLSGTNVTGTLAAARFPALTGDITTSAGSLTTNIAAGVINFGDINYTNTLASNPALATGQMYFGSTGILFEGSTADNFEGLLTTANITGSDKTWTLPNTTGTIALTSSAMTGTFDGNNFAGGAVSAGDLLYGSGNGVIAERSIGSTGQVLQVVGGLPTWVATSSLGISGGGGGGTFLSLTDTPDAYTADRILYTTGSGFASSSNFTFDGTTLGLANLDISSGLFNFGLATEFIIPNNTASAFAIATTSGGNALFEIDTTTGSEVVSLGTGAGDVLIGGGGQAVNLVFQEDSFIHGQGSSLITFGQSGDRFNFAVNLGIGTSTPSSKLTVAGDVFITGALYDNTNSAGTTGYVLQTTGSGFAWVATSSLGISSGAAFSDSAELAAILSDETGSGNAVFSNSPTLVTPNLGTPSTLTLTNATGLPIVAGTTGTLSVARGGTGATNDSGARSNLGLVIGTNVLAPNGNGSSLTNLNASALTTGTVASARISGAYANITGVGALGAGSITSGFGSIDIGASAFTTTGNVTTGDILPSSNQTYSIGATNDRFLNVWAEGIEIGNSGAGIPTVTDTTPYNYGSVTPLTSFSYSHTVSGSSRILVVGVANLTAAVSGVTYGGESLTKIEDDTGGSVKASLWYIVNPAAGANNVVITTASGVSRLASGASTVINVDQTNPLRNSNVTTVIFDTSVTESVSTEDGDLVYALISSANKNQSPIAGVTEEWDQATGLAVGGAGYSRQAIGVSTSIGSTWVGSSAAAILRATFRQAAQTTYLGVDSATGNVGIGTTTPSAQLTTTGSVRFATFGAGTLETDASGNVTVSSDERLKTINDNYVQGINVIRGLEPIVYNWNQASGLDQTYLNIGFSAQNVQALIPEAVGTTTNGFLSLSTRPILAALVNATKEQQLFIDEFLGISSTTASSSLSLLEQAGEESVWSKLKGLLSGFTDGVLSLAGLVVGSEIKPTGITSYDIITGDPYCIYVANGETKTVPGTCAGQNWLDQEPIVTTPEVSVIIDDTDGVESDTGSSTQNVAPTISNDSATATSTASSSTEITIPVTDVATTSMASTSVTATSTASTTTTTDNVAAVDTSNEDSEQATSSTSTSESESTTETPDNQPNTPQSDPDELESPPETDETIQSQPVTDTDSS